MPLDWAIRYAPIVGFIRKAQPGSILEVGSGPQGLAYYIRDKCIVGTDVVFNELPLKNIRAVISSGEFLPFRSKSFDLVVSSDMMEHVPVELRSRAIHEMLRVTKRHLIVGFPSGRIARRHDVAVSESLTRQKLKTPQWLKEHLQHDYPTSISVIQALPQKGINYQVYRNANWRIHKAIVLLQTNYRFNRLIRLLKLDSLSLIRAASFVINAGRTYREILYIEIPDPVSF